MQNYNVLENAARILYGNKTKKEEDDKNLRNSLINELGNSLEAKHILYSLTEELKKIKEKENKNSFKGKMTGMADSIDSSVDNIQAPLPNIKNKNSENVAEHEVKLLDKFLLNPK